MVLGFDFFFVKPYLTFAVHDAQYFLTFVVMGVVAVFISNLVSQLRERQLSSELHLTQTAALYELSKNLMGAVDVAGVADSTHNFIHSQLNFDGCVLFHEIDSQGCLVNEASGAVLKVAGVCPALRAVELHFAEGVFFQSGELKDSDATGEQRIDAIFEDEGQSCMGVVLQGSDCRRGVLLIRADGRGFLALREARVFLEAVASVVAIALERLYYLNQAHKNLSDASTERLRGSILAALSHDLRTPLAAMYGVADGLRWLEPKPDFQVLSAADKLCAQSMRLNRMVTNLLVYAQLHSRDLILKREWVPVEELVGASASSLAETLNSFDLRIAVDDVVLSVDAVLFDRVLANLLDNAIKFNALPLGRGVIDLTVKVGEREGVRVCVLRVCNRALECDAMRLLRMVGDYNCMDKVHSDWGTGLGLAICRAIVLAHGGEFWAEQCLFDGDEAVAVCLCLPVTEVMLCPE